MKLESFIRRKSFDVVETMYELSLRLGQSLNQRQSQRLSHEQRHRLEQAFRLELCLKLCDPEIQSATKGLDGIIEAARILREKDVAGILIGGVMKEVYCPQGVTRESLAKHKDVDVMVLSYESDIEPYLGGIDWWTPKQGFVKTTSDSGSIQRHINYFQNGRETVTLRYTVADEFLGSFSRLEPGRLYVPSAQDVIELALAEVNRSGDFDFDLESSAVKRIIRHNLPPLGQKVGILPAKHLCASEKSFEFSAITDKETEKINKGEIYASVHDIPPDNSYITYDQLI